MFTVIGKQVCYAFLKIKHSPNCNTNATRAFILVQHTGTKFGIMVSLQIVSLYAYNVSFQNLNPIGFKFRKERYYGSLTIFYTDKYPIIPQKKKLCFLYGNIGVSSLLIAEILMFKQTHGQTLMAQYTRPLRKYKYVYINVPVDFLVSYCFIFYTRSLLCLPWFCA